MGNSHSLHILAGSVNDIITGLVLKVQCYDPVPVIEGVIPSSKELGTGIANLYTIQLINYPIAVNIRKGNARWPDTCPRKSGLIGYVVKLKDAFD